MKSPSPVRVFLALALVALCVVAVPAPAQSSGAPNIVEVIGKFKEPIKGLLDSVKQGKPPDPALLKKLKDTVTDVFDSFKNNTDTDNPQDLVTKFFSGLKKPGGGFKPSSGKDDAKSDDDDEKSKPGGDESKLKDTPMKDGGHKGKSLARRTLIFSRILGKGTKPHDKIQVSPSSKIPVPVTLSFFRKDLENGDSSNCPPVIFIFARGTFEPGNVGIVVGPLVARRLKEKYGNDKVWVQGVGGNYKASISGIVGEVLSGPFPSSAVKEANRLFEMAHSKCPKAKIVAGGYSQGAMLMSGTLSRLEPEVKDQVKGITLFGYPGGANIFHGKIPNFPEEKTHSFCAPGDAVCYLIPFILPPHLSYFTTAGKEAPQFLEEKIGDIS